MTHRRLLLLTKVERVVLQIGALSGAAAAPQDPVSPRKPTKLLDKLVMQLDVIVIVVKFLRDLRRAGLSEAFEVTQAKMLVLERFGMFEWTVEKKSFAGLELQIVLELDAPVAEF